MTQLVKINPADYGLEESKAKQISDMFKPMLNKMVDLEKEYNEIPKDEINESVCDRAKELRLKYVKVRTGTAEIHKELKQFYLQGGRFVDGWKNAQLMASQGIEENLMSIEKHYENIERGRINKLQELRTIELEKYEVESIPDSLGSMQEDVWKNFLAGTKMNYDAVKEAERKAEQERIEAERKVKAEQERIRKENEQLKKEAEEKERKRIAEEKAHEAEMKKAQAEKDRIEKELNDKRIAEEKAEADRLAKIEAEKAKGDEDKITDLINDLNALGTKYTFQSEANRKMYAETIASLDKIIAHIICTIPIKI